MNASTTVSIRTERKQSVLAQILWITGFAFLTGVGAQIEIPHSPVPYTLQTFFVLISGALLGKRNGAASQLLYIVAGAAGLPLFSGFGTGLARLMGPTGGYLLAFPIAAFLIGYLLEGWRSFWQTLLAMSVGLFVIFTLGTLQLQIIWYRDWSLSIANGFLIFSWWDVLKLLAAATFVRQIARRTPLAANP